MPVKRTLEVRSQKSILHVHAWSQALLRNPTQDKRLVGSLLGVLTEHNYPTSVENPVDVIVATIAVVLAIGIIVVFLTNVLVI